MLPKVNQILHIQVNSIDEEESKIEYRSRIADVTDTSIVIEIPMNEQTRRLKKLYHGDELNTFFVGQGGVKNYFTTTVTGYREDVIRLVELHKPEPEAITQVQRRNFLRVPAELEIAVKLSDQIQFIGVTEDVGGGGISFVCDRQIPIGMNMAVSCWLLVPFKNGNIEHIPFNGEVVRVKQLETGKQLAMLSFVDILDRERQKLIRFCFERQMDFRKR
ncbi:glycosyl transferase [Paenibacillus aceris]|uniref:C-di-GMP-binding flagellar brake protein YcgR n=1 Tax=Paenibacillus aceris TaxID=869555 RepID=A0ABS4HTR3_9BACL|nr:flagellar brake domain-containing protein [Paenibacillus aceris]MBP1961994.1 c-di-GMP-binding flagellar brake protein YcgR [Paenibacillus aceris]NHW34157.1 glycosyl transferase [Paenibacillus aceris]